MNLFNAQINALWQFSPVFLDKNTCEMAFE